MPLVHNDYVRQVCGRSATQADGRHSDPRGARIRVIVVDASALLEFLLQTPLGTRVEARLLRDGDEFHSSHLIDVEVTQGLRRRVRACEVSADRAAEAIEDLVDLDLHVTRILIF